MTNPSFECQNVWDGPSVGNSLISCLVNTTHIASLFSTDSERAEVGATFIPLGVVVLVLIIYPLFLALRYCVDFCGSNKRRPGHCCYGGEEWDDQPDAVKNKQYDPKDAACLRTTAYLSLFLSFVPMGLLFVGTGDIQTGYNTIFAEIFELVGWAEAKQAELKDFVTYSNGSFIAPVNDSLIRLTETAIAGYNNDISKADATNAKYVDVIKSVSIVFAVVPVISLLLNALFATFDVRRCFPLINSVFHVLLLCFYAVIASAVLILGILTTRVCGERDRAVNLEPGIGTWWVVPRCNEIAAFDPVLEFFNYSTRESSRLACEQLSFHCNNVNPVYVSATPEKLFYCPQLNDPSTQCSNSTEATNIITSNTVKALTGFGGPSCGSSSDECAVKNCRENCTDSTQKAYSEQIYLRMIGASGVQSGEDIFTSEISNCSALLYTAMTSFKSCQVIQSSVFYVGVGSCIFVGLFVIGLVVIFRGQKRFFKPLHVKKEKKKPSEKNSGWCGCCGDDGRGRSRSPSSRSPAGTPRSRSPTSTMSGSRVSVNERKYRK